MIVHYLSVSMPLTTRHIQGYKDGAGCNRLVTSISKLALGPLPCQLSPGGDAFGAYDVEWVRVMTGVKQGDSGQQSKPAGLIH